MASSQKSATLAGFKVADSLYLAKDYKNALAEYEKLKLSDYLEPAHDSLLFERLDILYSHMEEQDSLNGL